MTEMEKLRLLYLDDLRREVSYGGKVRPRARRVDTVWAKIRSATELDPINIDNYNDIWVWSDIHFGHGNIIKYCDRPFASADEMNETMIANHNSVVKPEDLVIWVGDVSFMREEPTNEILKQLNGDRILIIGNHDIDNKRKRLKVLDFNEHHLLYTIDDPTTPLLFTHYTMENTPLPWINIHGHVHNNPYDVQDSLQHINVSVEVLGYTPMHLNRLKEMAKTRLTSMEDT